MTTGKKLAAVCLAIAIGSASMGFGIGAADALFGKGESVAAVSVAASETAAVDTAVGGYALDYKQVALESALMSVSDIYDTVKNSVVSINMRGSTLSFFGEREFSGAGSGVVISEDGAKLYIVTNYHVVDSAKSVTISFDDKTQITANFVGGDSVADIAVISVAKSDLTAAGVKGWKTIDFADSSKVKIGDFVLAVGNALGEGKSAAFGIVGSETHSVVIDDTGTTMELIRTDAAINPGNSGGALVNSKGELVGINTIKVSDQDVEGMGYAIPSNIVKGLIDTIMATGIVERPYLGVSTKFITDDLRGYYNFPSAGAYVSSVESDSTAVAIGIKKYDLITAVNGVAVKSDDDLKNAIAAVKVGADITVTVYRPASSGWGINSKTTWAETTLTGVMKNYPNMLSF